MKRVRTLVSSCDGLELRHNFFYTHLNETHPFSISLLVVQVVGLGDRIPIVSYLYAFLSSHYRAHDFRDYVLPIRY
jgi:hypothetical protein